MKTETKDLPYCEDRNEHCTDDIDGYCRDCWLEQNQINL